MFYTKMMELLKASAVLSHRKGHMESKELFVTAVETIERLQAELVREREVSEGRRVLANKFMADADRNEERAEKAETELSALKAKLTTGIFLPAVDLDEELAAGSYYCLVDGFGEELLDGKKIKVAKIRRYEGCRCGAILRKFTITR